MKDTKETTESNRELPCSSSCSPLLWIVGGCGYFCTFQASWASNGEAAKQPDSVGQIHSDLNAGKESNHSETKKRICRGLVFSAIMEWCQTRNITELTEIWLKF